MTRARASTGETLAVLAAALVTTALCTTPALAQAPPAANPPEAVTELRGVTVIAPDPRTLQKQVEGFVADVTVSSLDWSLARWRGPVCPLVAGLSKRQGEIVLGRLSQVAQKAGAPLGRRDCYPNLFIVVTDEPERMLRAWKDRDGSLFGYDLPARVSRFLQTERPVRVWYNASPVAPEGETLMQSTNFNHAKTNFRAKGTRLEFNGLKAFDSVIVVADAAFARELTTFQLADYAVMVGLTELSLDANIETAPTILRLFDEGPADQARPPALSAWDEAFLEALYHTDSRNKGQRSSITQRVVRKVASPPASEPTG